MAAQTTAWVNFNGKDVGVKITIDGINDKIDNLGKKGKKNIDSLSASFKNLKSQISSMSGSMRSLPLIGGLGAAGIFTGGKMAVEKFAGRESTETAIGMFSKTEERTASNLAFLKRTSRELGIVYDTAADGYKRLMQNLSSTNMPMEEQNALFKKISTVIRVSNVDNTAAESVYRAFGDMFSKGGIQAQELKTQLANAIGGVMPAMKQAFPGMNIASGLDAGAFNKQIHVVKLINQLYANNEQGLAKAQTQTSFKLAIIQDDWANAMSSIGKSIVDSGALGVVSDMASELSVWVDANKELIKSSLKGGVDFVKKGFEWAIAHKDEIGSVLKSITAFTVGLGALNLITTFADPLKLAAGSMVIIGAAIDKAISDLNMAKKQEAEGKGKGYLDASESAGAGAGNLFFGAYNVLASPFNKQPKDRTKQATTGGKQFVYGLMQLFGGAAQGIRQGFGYMESNGGMNKGAELRTQKSVEMIGRRNLGFEEKLYPEDFRSEEMKSYFTKKEQDKAKAESDASILADSVIKGLFGANINMTVNIDSTGNATASFGATKGPGINVEKN